MRVAALGDARLPLKKQGEADSSEESLEEVAKSEYWSKFIEYTNNPSLPGCDCHGYSFPGCSYHGPGFHGWALQASTVPDSRDITSAKLLLYLISWSICMSFLLNADANYLYASYLVFVPGCMREPQYLCHG